MGVFHKFLLRASLGKLRSGAWIPLRGGILRSDQFRSGLLRHSGRPYHLSFARPLSLCTPLKMASDSVSTKTFKNNRLRLTEALAGCCPAQKCVVLLKGGVEVSQYSTDTCYLFRQESYFNWMFGVREPDFFGALDVSSGKSYLFAPRPTETYEIWMAKAPGTDDIKRKYGVDFVYFTDEISSILNGLGAKKILLLKGVNSDSRLETESATFAGMDKFDLDFDKLFSVISECRVVKTPAEIELIQRANDISSEAHKVVMKTIKPGMYEYQGEAAFQNYCYDKGGVRDVAYTCICGSGHNASVLHYGHAAAANDKRIHDGDLCLFDMGCLYHGYASDITCSFPANGKFTPRQKIVYNAVLSGRNAVIGAMKPGVCWVKMHKLALEKILTHLKENGLLVGEVSEMMKDNLGSTFQPHGLGHLLGCDVHDVGGYLEGHPERPEPFGLKSLRTARTLLEGMVLTVEPGCYFIDALLDKALSSSLKKYFNEEELKKYRGIGGVRIEDNVLVTATGARNLTKVPRTIEEIEQHMKA